jgi:hypothetical protein
MVKITLGEKGKRLKYEIYFIGIVLLIILGAFEVCRRIDWSALPRRQLEKNLLELETQIALDHQTAEKQTYLLVSRCGVWLRERWLIAYLYDERTKQGYFVGRIATPAFRQAVEAQKPLLDAGKPIDRKKIPRLRMIVEFKTLRCRLLVAEPETAQDRSSGGPVPR